MNFAEDVTRRSTGLKEGTRKAIQNFKKLREEIEDLKTDATDLARIVRKGPKLDNTEVLLSTIEKYLTTLNRLELGIK
jgi:hypothetical protein